MKTPPRNRVALSLPTANALASRPWRSSYPVAFPESEPWVVRVRLVVPLVSGVAVGQLEWSRIRKREEALQQLDLGNGVLNIHSVLNIGCGAVKISQWSPPPKAKQYALSALKKGYEARSCLTRCKRERCF